MRWLQFILSHSLFISFCAVALCYQTYELVNIPADPIVYGLVFSSTLCSYNFYWLISKYYFKENKESRAFFLENFSNIFFFVLPGMGMLYCLYIIPAVIPEMIVATALTLLYSVPLWPVKKLHFTRNFGFLKTILLAFTWAFVTVIIPAHSAILPMTLPVGLLFGARFLFMLLLCIIFDTRDMKIDKIHALRSLATDVSAGVLKRIIMIVFGLYTVSGLVLRYYFNEGQQLAAFLITGLFTWWVYRRSEKEQGYFFYYFLVDGLMLFSALATFVASIELFC